MLLILLGASVAIHALVLWRFAGDFHLSGTGAASLVLAPGLIGETITVPQPPSPLASVAPVVANNSALPETGPHALRNHAYPDMPAPGASPPQVPMVKWKGGAAKPVAGREALAGHASSASDASGGASDLKNPYLAGVRQKIAEMRNYPVRARLRRQTGLAVVRFSIRTDGRAENVKIVSGSGVGILDEAALNAVISASPFPPLPRGVGEKALVVEVPIKFERVTP